MRILQLVKIVPPAVILLTLMTPSLFLSGCTTTGSTSGDENLTIAAASKGKFKTVAEESASGKSPYTYKGRSFQAEWIHCRAKDAAAKKAPSVIVMHRDKAGFSPSSFCKGWIAQAFLASGFQVVTVNRPGFGGSTGKSDFAGMQSMAAIKAGIDNLTNQGVPKPIGSWGYSSGAAAAALFAKTTLSTQKFLILGGGIYDLEEAMDSTKDSYIKKELEAIYKSGGDDAFEFRSIAFDASGLPKRIALYHGKADIAIPPDQAESFQDSLVAGGYKATLQVIKGVAHNIPVGTHRHIIEVLAQAVGK